MLRTSLSEGLPLRRTYLRLTMMAKYICVLVMMNITVVIILSSSSLAAADTAVSAGQFLLEVQFAEVRACKGLFNSMRCAG